MDNLKSIKTLYILILITVSIARPHLAISQAFTWPTNTAGNVGMDQQHIDAAINRIESGEIGNIHSLIIIKDGQLITEKYFNNDGEKRPVFSVTKSIGSALLGIAKYKGADINTTDSIINYFPQYNNLPNQQQVSDIKLHDLLTQRHGYDWDEWSTSFTNSENPVDKMLNSLDWYRFVLNWPITEAPDRNFTYSTGHSSLMSPILKDRTDKDVYDFARIELFKPLNITDTHWEINISSFVQGQGIRVFPFGLEPLGFGLWLKPIDMAKFGELYRLGGIWQNTRLLSQEWIDQSVIRYSDNQSDPDVFTTPHQGYGYQWWITQITDDLGRPADMYYANGFAGQFIFVIPQYEAVIVTTAQNFSNSGPNMGNVLQENLLLAFSEVEDPTVPVTTDHNGSWYFPEHNGQGINFEVINDGNDITGFWYTYDTEGGKQRWFTFQGQITDGKANFNIYATSGGVFVDSQPVDIVEWGQGSLEIFNCSNGHFTFNSNSQNVNKTTTGEFPLSRLTASTGACITSNESKANLGHALR